MKHCSTQFTAESLVLANGAVLITPAASKEAVMHHISGEQKNYDSQDGYKQQAAKSEPGWPAPRRAWPVRITRHHSGVFATEDSPSVPAIQARLGKPQ